MEINLIKKQNIQLFSLPVIGVSLIFLSGLLSPEIELVIEIFLLIINLGKIRIDRILWPFLIILLIHTSITLMLGTDNLILALKQIIGITVGIVFWSTTISDTNMISIIDIYKKWSLFAAIIGIAQFICSSIGLSQFSNFASIIPQQASTTDGGRSASFLSEPSAYALIIFPMVFLILYSWIGKNRRLIKIRAWQKIVIILGYLFSFSTVGYLGIFIALIFILFEYRINLKQIIIILLAILVFWLLYKNVIPFQQRVDDTLSMILGVGNISQVNLSTQTITINKDIAFDSFKHTWGLGGGIGSHVLSYDKFIGDVSIPIGIRLLNQDDANSLLLRIISELGIIGIAYIIFYFVKYKSSKSEDTAYLRILSYMCVTYILLRLIRMGHYFNYGFGMFLVMYYRCFLLSKQVREQKSGYKSTSDDVDL